MQKLRAQCGNTLAFSTALLADHELWHRLRIIAEVLAPVQEWHSWQNNRSAPESVDFWKHMASESCFDHVNAVLAKVSDLDLLGSLRMATWGELSQVLRQLPADDPRVQMQDDLAQTLGSFCLAVAGRRLRSLAEMRDYILTDSQLCWVRMLAPP